MLNIKKNKALSELIALTFALNAIAPVAYASENENADTSANTTTTSSGQISLKTAQSDILERIAQTTASNFKKSNYNLTNDEINNLLNVPLSVEEEDSSLTQAEKDYNNLQLLVAKGLNTKEKRDTALAKLEEIEVATAKDPSVGGLTNAEKYVKQLLENYADIESRASISESIGSAITPTDSSIIAYRTILKVAKAERQSCINNAKAEAERNKTEADTSKCTLSDRGVEAAQILTYLTNQQVNQTTDSKKKANSTNATATTTTSGETQYACNSTATPYPAINDKTKCCVSSQKPYYKSSTNTCVASLVETTNSNSNRDDDDDDKDNSNALLMQYLLAQQQNCQSNPYLFPYSSVLNANSIVDRCTLPGGGGTSGTNGKKKSQDSTKSTDSKPTKSTGGKRSADNNKTTLKSAKSHYSNNFIKQIGNLKIVFNEKSTPEKVQGVDVYTHIADSSSEYQLKVLLDKTTYTAKVQQSDGTTKEEERPIYINLVSTNFVSDMDGNNVQKYMNYQKNQKPNEFITVVYPETKTPADGYHFKKVAQEAPYATYIEVTDGTNRIFYTVYYKIRDISTRNLDNDKEQKAGEITIELTPNDNENYGLTSGNIFGKLTSATWQNDKCYLNINGKYQSSDVGQEASEINTSVAYEQINKSDCEKLNNNAKSKNYEITMQNVTQTFNEDADALVYEADNASNPAIKDIDSGKYLSASEYNSEYKSTTDYSQGLTFVQPFGLGKDGYQIDYDTSGKFIKYTDDGARTMTTKEISEQLLDGKEIPDGATVDFKIGSGGRRIISITSKDGSVENVDINDDKRTTNSLKRRQGIITKIAGIPSTADEVATSIKKEIEKAQTTSIFDYVTDKITDVITTVKNEVKEAYNDAKNNNDNTKKKPVKLPKTKDISSGTPVTVDATDK